MCAKQLFLFLYLNPTLLCCHIVNRCIFPKGALPFLHYSHTVGRCTENLWALSLMPLFFAIFSPFYKDMIYKCLVFTASDASCNWYATFVCFYTSTQIKSSLGRKVWWNLCLLYLNIMVICHHLLKTLKSRQVWLPLELEMNDLWSISRLNSLSI